MFIYFSTLILTTFLNESLSNFFFNFVGIFLRMVIYDVERLNVERILVGMKFKIGFFVKRLIAISFAVGICKLLGRVLFNKNHERLKILDILD